MFAGIVGGRETISTSEIVTACRRFSHAPTKIYIRRILLRRRVCRGANRLLAVTSGGQQFVKACFCADFREQWVRKQIRVRAIVLLDGDLQHMQCSLLLTAERKQSALVIPR